MLDDTRNTYYAINRPPTDDCIPAGALEAVVYQHPRPVPNSGRYAHGHVVYPAPLEFRFVWKYDLFPATASEQEDYWDWRDENEL